MWRKSALSLLALGLAATSLAAQTPSGVAPRPVSARDSALSQRLKARPGDSLGRLEVPEAAGRAQPVVTARDNTEIIKALEHKIRCTCGCNLDVFTCRTTDFTCTTSPAMHRVVLARLDSGMTAAEVEAAFVRQYGEVVLMQPPKRGFNLAAYIMPFVGLLAGLVIVGLVIRGWFRARPKTPLEGAAAPEAPPAASDDDLERLREELERFEA
jgi:cytochrome c-type biogenesis protein CcmH